MICYGKVGHHHKMDKQGLDLENESIAASGEENQAVENQAQKCVEVLVHMWRCGSRIACGRPSCYKLKKVAMHYLVNYKSIYVNTYAILVLNKCL